MVKGLAAVVCAASLYAAEIPINIFYDEETKKQYCRQDDCSPLYGHFTRVIRRHSTEWSKNVRNDNFFVDGFTFKPSRDDTDDADYFLRKHLLDERGPNNAIYMYAVGQNIFRYTKNAKQAVEGYGFVPGNIFLVEVNSLPAWKQAAVINHEIGHLFGAEHPLLHDNAAQPSRNSPEAEYNFNMDKRNLARIAKRKNPVQAQLEDIPPQYRYADMANEIRDVLCYAPSLNNTAYLRAKADVLAHAGDRKKALRHYFRKRELKHLTKMHK
jgi:hypothetical protein